MRTARGYAALVVLGGAGFALVLASAVPARAEPAGSTENRCVTCHEVERLPFSLGHSMDDWRGSAHGRGGIGCEKCHGGDPSQADPDKAHQGVLPATNGASTVSTRNIAKTCGKCHEEQYKAYESTDHAKAISEQGDAATCVTCHGSMATTLPTRAELKRRCRDCHDKTVKAAVALSWLVTARRQLQRTDLVLEQAKTKVPDWYKGAQKRFHEMEKSYSSIALEWHRFDTEASIKHSRNVVDLGQLLVQEAKVKMKMADEDGD